MKKKGERDKKKRGGEEKFVRRGKGRADAEEKGVPRARSFLSRRRVTFNRNKNFPYFPNTHSWKGTLSRPPFCNASIPLYGWNCTETQPSFPFTRNVFLVIVIDDDSWVSIEKDKKILKIPFSGKMDREDHDIEIWTILFALEIKKLSRGESLIGDESNRCYVEKLNRIPRV